MTDRRMFLIFSSPAKIRKLKRFLELKGLEVKETKDDQYLFTLEDPSVHIPFSLKPGTKVMPVSERERYHRMFKEYGEFAYLFRKFAPEPGMAVRIIKGDYGSLGLVGIVKDVGKATCTVEATVWGKIVKIVVGHGDVEKIDPVPELS